MKPNKLVKRKIDERYKKAPFSSIDKFLRQNLDVDKYLTALVNHDAWFENKRRAFSLIAKNIYEPIKCKICNNIIPAYKVLNNVQYCSSKCSQSSPERLEKVKQTTMNRYGVDNAAKSKQIQDKIKQTNLEKYGYSNVFQNEDIKEKIKKTNLEKYGRQYFVQTVEFAEKSKKTNLQNLGVEFPSQSLNVQEKCKQTNLRNRGVQHPAQSPDVIHKIKQTCINKYGVDCVFKAPDVNQKRQKTWQDKYGGNPLTDMRIINKRKLTNIEKYGCQFGYTQSIEYMIIQYNKIKQRFSGKIQPLFDEKDYRGIHSKQVYKWRCVKCGNVFEQDIHFTDIDKEERLLPRCLNCYPYVSGFSKQEKELLDFIKLIYNGEIIENDRKILNGKQLDIVLSELKLAIQFNGVYWHSDKDKNYHLNKTELCESKGYRLIHIWQDEWKESSEIIKNKLKSIIKGNEIIENNILDRCWYSILQFQNYEIIEPTIIIREGFQIWNCGYLKIIKQ